MISLRVCVFISYVCVFYNGLGRGSNKKIEILIGKVVRVRLFNIALTPFSA